MLLVRKEKDTDTLFGGLEESNLEADTLIRCRVVKASEDSEYSQDDIVLVRADLLRVVKFEDCPADVLLVGNQDSVFAGYV